MPASPPLSARPSAAPHVRVRGWRPSPLRALTLLVALMVAAYFAALASLPELPRLLDTPGHAWSRAARVGTASLTDPPGLAALPDGWAAVAWVGRMDGRPALEFAGVDERGIPDVARRVAVPVTFPHQVVLFADGGRGLHLAWIDGDATAKEVYAVHLGAGGAPLDRPRRVSAPGVEVSMLAGAPLPDGGLALAWSSDSPEHRGAYLTTLDPSGRPLEVGRLLDPGGLAPAAALDAAGGLHLAWLRVVGPGDLRVVYAPPHGQALALARVPGIRPPRLRLTLDRAYAYILWAQDLRGAAGQDSHVYLASTPLAAPRATEARLIELPHDARADFGRGGDDLPTRQLWFPNVIPVQADAAVASVTALQASRRGGPQPIFQLLLRDGRLADARQIGAGDGLATGGTLARDAAGALHAAWLQGVEGEQRIVWQAGTDPGAVAFLGQWTRQDVRATALRGLLALALTAAASVLFPFRYLPGALVLGGGLWLAGEERLEQRRGRVLAAALAVQFGANILLAQTAVLTGYLDQSIPADLRQPLAVFAWPLLAFLVGLGLLRLARRVGLSFVQQLVVFCLADGWLTTLPFFVLLLRGYLA